MLFTEWGRYGERELVAVMSFVATMFPQNKFLLKADFSFCWSHDEKYIEFLNLGSWEKTLRVLFFHPF